MVLAAGVDEGREDDEVDGELAVEVGADGRDVPAVGPAGEELGLRGCGPPSRLHAIDAALERRDNKGRGVRACLMASL